MHFTKVENNIVYLFENYKAMKLIVLFNLFKNRIQTNKSVAARISRRIWILLGDFMWKSELNADKNYFDVKIC